MSIGELLAEQLDGTRDWTLKLLADFSGDDWSFQPGAGLAHPLWLCGHLAVAQHLLIHVRCLNDNSVIDGAFAEHFPIGIDAASAAEHDYPPSERILSVIYLEAASRRISGKARRHGAGSGSSDAGADLRDQI